MKRILPILLLSLAIIGCSPVKRMQRTQEQSTATSQQATDIDQTAKASSSAQATETERRDSTGVREAEKSTNNVKVKVTEEFDTDKPVDPATGTPPLKNRTTEIEGSSESIKAREEATENTERQTDAASEYQEQTDTSIRHQESEQSESSATSEVTEKSGLSPLRKWLGGVLAGAILTIIIYLIIKNKSKWLTFLKRILRI